MKNKAHRLLVICSGSCFNKQHLLHISAYVFNEGESCTSACLWSVCGPNCVSWDMWLLVCLCACKHFCVACVYVCLHVCVCGFLAALWSSHLTGRHQNKLNIWGHIKSCASFYKQEIDISYRNSAENDQNKWHTFLQRCLHNREHSHNVCRPFILQCYSSATVQLWGRGRQAPFNSDREGEGAWMGGREQPQGFYFFLTLCHMSSLYLVLQSPFSSPVLLETWWALRAPHLHSNMMHKRYRTAL